MAGVGLGGPPRGDGWDVVDYLRALGPSALEKMRAGRMDPSEYGRLGPPTEKMLAAIDAVGLGPADLPPGFAATIKAYHGSPHRFEKFSTEKIGTGEGAQAYGHGLYFAGNPKVAEGYRDALSDPKRALQSGNTAKTGSISARLSNAFGGDGSNWDRGGRNIDDIARRLAVNSDSTPDGQEILTFSDGSQFINAGDWWDVSDGRIGSGHLYDVTLRPDEEDLLDWDAPLSAQPEKVRGALEGLGYDGGSWRLRVAGPDANDQFVFNSRAEADAEAARWKQFGDEYEVEVWGANDPVTGASVYRDLDGNMRRVGEASAKLRAAGIPGIRYLDAGSRGANGGTRNYVIFDDADVTIDAINGRGIGLGR